MVVKKGINYCEVGIMSSCTASNLTERSMCDGWDKSNVREDCMWRNESLNCHCSNPMQQAAFHANGIITVEMYRESKAIPEEELVLDLSEFVVEKKKPIVETKTCLVCNHQTSCPTFANMMMRPNCGPDEFEVQADSCIDYDPV